MFTLLFAAELPAHHLACSGLLTMAAYWALAGRWQHLRYKSSALGTARISTRRAMSDTMVCRDTLGRPIDSDEETTLLAEVLQFGQTVRASLAPVRLPQTAAADQQVQRDQHGQRDAAEHTVAGGK